MFKTHRGTGVARIALALCAAICGRWAVEPAHAAPPIPNAVQPGAVERGLQRPLIKPQDNRIELPAPQGFEAPANAASIHVKLLTVELTGNSALSTAELSSTYQRLIGKDVSVADLYQSANAITALYVAKGYALSFAVIPAQSLTDGHAKIDVIEGYVAEVQFKGDTAKLPPAMNAYAEHIKASRPLTNADLERFLLLANDLGGYSAKSVFDRIENGPRGATRLIITLDHQTFSGTVTVDNRGSRAFGPIRIDAEAGLADVFGHGEDLRLRLLRALDGNELTYGSASLSVPLDGDGTLLRLAGSYSDAHPGLPALSALNFASSGWIAHVGVDHPFIRSRTDNLTLSLEGVGKWLHSELAAMPNSRDKIFTLIAGASFWTRGTTNLTTLDARLTQGLDIMGATTSSSPLRSRVNGSGVFTALNLDAGWLQSLGGNFDVYLSASGQAASRGLLASEQCGYGGGSVGRGFDDSEIVGDDCAIGSLELRYNVVNPPIIDWLQPYGFADAGTAWLNGTLLPGEKRTDSGESVGAGLRLGFLEHVSGSVEYAQPVSHIVSQEGNREGRVFLSLKGAF